MQKVAQMEAKYESYLKKREKFIQNNLKEHKRKVKESNFQFHTHFESIKHMKTEQDSKSLEAYKEHIESLK